MEIPLFWQVQDILNGIGCLCLSHGIECSECRAPGIRFLPYGTDLDSDKDVNSAQIEENKQKHCGRNL